MVARLLKAVSEREIRFQITAVGLILHVQTGHEGNYCDARDISRSQTHLSIKQRIQQERRAGTTENRF